MAYEHWRYFIALERDVEVMTRYVEPSQANFKTYSIEFARLLLGVCSEIDVVAKLLCQRLNQAAPRDNIDNYREVIAAGYPQLHTIKVLVRRHEDAGTLENLVGQAAASCVVV